VHQTTQIFYKINQIYCMPSTTDNASGTERLTPALIFVYNADSGLLNMAADYVHKIFSPSTYGCNLCAVTFGNTGMKGEWREFVAHLGVPAEFLHRDEFLEHYNLKDAKFPAAFLKKGDTITLFIDHNEINSSKTLKDLMDLVTKKVKGIT